MQASPYGSVKAKHEALQRFADGNGREAAIEHTQRLNSLYLQHIGLALGKKGDKTGVEREGKKRKRWAEEQSAAYRSCVRDLRTQQGALFLLYY